jgi:hypothetical protein
MIADSSAKTVVRGLNVGSVGVGIGARKLSISNTEAMRELQKQSLQKIEGEHID